MQVNINTASNINNSNKFSDFKHKKLMRNNYAASVKENPDKCSQSEATTISKPRKAFILFSSLAGTLAALALIGKKQNLNIFKWSEFKKLNFEEKAMRKITLLSLGSLIGGLSSGLIVDGTNKRDKLRESVQQLVGNIVFPISFVGIANWLWSKAAKKVKLPDLKETSSLVKGLSSVFKKIKPASTAKVCNAAIKASPTVAATFIGLGTGILTGNKIANLMNNKIFKEKNERKVKVTDLAAHVDDTLIGATLVAQNVASGTSGITALTTKLIPPALVVPGYMTGTAQ